MKSKGGSDAAGTGKYKKSKRLSWTLGRKKSRDEAFVADGSGKVLAIAGQQGLAALARHIGCMHGVCQLQHAGLFGRLNRPHQVALLIDFNKCEKAIQLAGFAVG